VGLQPVRYELLARDGAARLGRVVTPHGAFDSPAFMPVGTAGSIKGLTPGQVAATGAQCVLANTYHLMLRPGEKVVAALGDLHGMMGWTGPILTDSGGYQVFSLADTRTIGDDGIHFRSHIDGSSVHLTPRRSIQVQNDLGADVIMMLDECADPAQPIDYHKEAARRTLAWARECIEAHGRPNEQALFGIVQGGTDRALREQCVRDLAELDLPGYALGGLAVGEGYEVTKQVVAYTTPLLPADRPRYLMGVGYPRDIVAAVAVGIDMFDCVLPTRNGRNAYAFAAGGALRLRNAAYQQDASPIEPGCDCYACRHFSRGAIRHFFGASEMLGPILVSVHNMRFYQRLMADIRRAIRQGTFSQFCLGDPRSKLGPAPVTDQLSEQVSDQRMTRADGGSERTTT
jgi:queuine tRNA-ribosyltransferase